MSAKAHHARGHTVKHVKASKAKRATAKHHPAHHKQAVTHHATGHKVHAKGTHPHHAKAVGFAVGDLLPVCAFEAVAMSLRLAGQPVHDDEVAELWHLLGEPEEGVPVGEALAVAARFGLAGFRPSVRSYCFATRFEALTCVDGEVMPLDPRLPDGPGVNRAGLILGVDRPGPHAVLATRDGWWSWGELYDPWPCRVSEAWAVSWS